MARQKYSYRLSDELWEKMKPLIPKHKNTHRFGGGRPRRPDRDCMEAIFFVLRTGCQWKALDATGICPGSTAHDRFQEWVKAGVFWNFWRAGLLEYDELKGIDWSWLSADGAQTKAPLGGKKNRPQPDRSQQAGSQTQPVGRRTRRGSGRSSRRCQPPRFETASENPAQRAGELSSAQTSQG